MKLISLRESIRQNYLLKKAICFQDLVEKFDKSLSKACSTQFINLLTLAVFNHKSKGVLESKISKKDRKFRNFAQSVAKYKKVVKICVTTKNESFEIGFDYNKDEAFVNEQDLEKLVENFEKFGNNFSINQSTKFHVGKRFDCLKKEVSKLVDLLSEEGCNLDEAETKLKKVKESKFEIKMYKKMVKSMNGKFKEKQVKYKRKYYNTYVQQKKNSFMDSCIKQPGSEV